MEGPATENALSRNFVLVLGTMLFVCLLSSQFICVCVCVFLSGRK